jgi:hypothetical protein
MAEWVEARPLSEILDGIEQAGAPQEGAALRARMLEDLGVEEGALLDRAHARGQGWSPASP